MQKQNSELKVKLKERSYKYSIQAIEFLDSLPKDSTFQIVTRQLLRSATSIGANIVEAQAASSKRDFTNFLNHALKSANESLYWFGLLQDAKKVHDVRLGVLIKETGELASILGASILTLKNKL